MFLFSDWEADPRMVMALGGTAGMRGQRTGTMGGTSCRSAQTDRRLGADDKVFGIRWA